MNFHESLVVVLDGLKEGLLEREFLRRSLEFYLLRIEDLLDRCTQEALLGGSELDEVQLLIRDALDSSALCLEHLCEFLDTGEEIDFEELLSLAHDVSDVIEASQAKIVANKEALSQLTPMS